ncbi:MAG TPA: hypothetical protein VGG96_08935 [Steroidobacteraceae bacterium]|jgi:hypothetical protein
METTLRKRTCPQKRARESRISSYSAAAEAAAEQRPYFFFAAFFLAFFFAFAMLALQLTG